MDFVANKGDFLYLDSGVYQVVKCLEFEGEAYLIISKAPESFEEIFENPASRIQFVREIYQDDKYYIDTIENPQLLKNLYEEMRK